MRVSGDGFPGSKIVNVHASQFILGNPYITIWPTGSLYQYPQAEQEIEIASSSPDDDFNGGIGLQEIKIEGLNQNLEPLEENVQLTGNSPVFTVEKFLRVNNITPVTVGTSLYSQGQITGLWSISSQTSFYLNFGENNSQQAVYTIPINKVCHLRKLNVDYLKQKGLFKDDVVYNKENPLIIDKELIINIFGHPKNIEKITHPKSCIGFTNGLYTSGNEIGGILSIQVVKNNYGNKDNFMIEITGNLKKVMKESVKYAFNCAMNIVSEKQKKTFYKNYPQGVFCHFSDASSVKDGPSAGSAIFLTFYSVIVNKKINNKIALTGEIDMFGNIKAIGGVRLKMQGAYKSGIETVFLPEENKNDIEEIIKNKSIEFNSTKKYILVSNVNDIISNVF